VGSHVGQNPSIKYLSKRNPFRPVKPTSTLYDVAILLHETHCHRVPVVHEGKCVGIMSQSALIKFLSENRDSIAEDVTQTLEDIKIGIKFVVTVPEESTAHEAFSIIEKSNLSGIGVVDEDGKLVGNTSARDIKYFVLDKGQLSLDEPIMDYLASVRQSQLVEKDRVPVSTVRISATIGRVIGLMGKTQYHRLFIVDSEGKPIGVLSVSDILAFATYEPAKEGEKDHKDKSGQKAGALRESPKEDLASSLKD